MRALLMATYIMALSRCAAFRSLPIVPSVKPLSPRRHQSLSTASASATDDPEIVAVPWHARTESEGCWRPTVNDVERISFGKPAKKKGTGSRNVPHRLNEDERFLFDQARRKGFLEIAGSGWRAQRREAPLINTYRSLCDARGQASIIMHKGNTGMDDALVVDLSPLRVEDSFEQIANDCLKILEGGIIVAQGIGTEKDEEYDYELVEDKSGSPWTTRPIYQLPPYCVAWELPRSEAKDLGKKMAQVFSTAEEKKETSKKPIGVKPGKGRRHGGYGIG